LNQDFQAARAVLVSHSSSAEMSVQSATPVVERRHPCGHKCYPGREPEDWCIECKYGDKPYH
jgi:hypothetical protein